MDDADRVQEQLERILASPDFVHAPRHRKFLTFVVQETLAGRGEELKEFVVAMTVFEKPSSFDPRNDSTVRTEASKLRARLARYYSGPGIGDSIRIDLPRGGYLPVFSASAEAPPSEPIEEPVPVLPTQQLPPKPPSKRWTGALVAMLILLPVAVGVWFLRDRSARPPSLVSLRPLKTGPGPKRTPAFSPDGQKIAFSWSEPNSNHWHIWVADVEGRDSPKRLTSAAAQDWSPSWSPDGRTIAFVRNPYSSEEVYVIPSEGGVESKLPGVQAFRLVWMPDGKSLLVQAAANGNQSLSALLLIDLKTAAKTQVTFPTPQEGRGHTNPAVSPDGRSVAYLSVIGDIRHILTAPLVGSERKTDVEIGAGSFAGIDWAPDGESLFVATSGNDQYPRLNRLRGSVLAPVEGMERSQIGHVAVWRGTPTRLAGSFGDSHHEVWTQTPGEANSDRRLILSGANSWAPQYSPDGTSVAFVSDRSGSAQIWIAREDGTGETQITSGLPCAPTSVRWDPTTVSRLVFDCKGHDGGLYLVDAKGGRAARMSTPADAESPSFSTKGKRVYFTSRKSGRYEVWSIAEKEGSVAVQITQNGAVQGLESSGGKSLVYRRSEKDGGLWRVNLADGRETRCSISCCRVGGKSPMAEWP